MHRAKLAKFCGGRQHQNVVLKCGKIGYTDIRGMKDIVYPPEQDMTNAPPVEGKFYLFLDQVTDPQNFGSILRSAMFIGVDGVIVNKRNACGLTPVVSKVSSGAVEFIPIYTVKFVSHFFEDAKKHPLNFKIISTNLDDEDLKEAAIEHQEESDNETDDEEVITFGDLDLPYTSNESPSQKPN
jgi:tRNA G18 (ribose-2'-O)-methylase SpoU